MRKGLWACISIFFLQMLAAASLFAATKIYLPEASSIREQLVAREATSSEDLESVLGFSNQDGLRLLNEYTDDNDITHSRYVQLYNGIPVWGHHIIAATDEDDAILSLHGTRVAEIEADLAPEALITRGLKKPSQVLAAMKKRHVGQSLFADAEWVFENEIGEKVVYVDEDGKARLCYHVSFFADTAQGGNPARPVILVDAETEDILLEFDGLTYANGTGPGGNLKTKKYRFGTEYPAFEVTQSGTNCSMLNTNVKTINLNHSTTDPAGSPAYSYVCPENTFKEINGGYSPLNDAHSFGAVVFNMYKDWFNTAPLTFQLKLRVHYSNSYENAFWNGSSMTFGDGKTLFYPLVSLDVVAHEVSHGFTEQNSKLIYSKQSGGINEAFSDMAGEAGEFFFKNKNDFMVGFEIFKSTTQALRYMDNPPKDGKSIGSAKNYYDGLDVHYSSGVFNKAFWALATTAGWDTKKAFAVFVKANQDNWEPSTNFQQGAEGARDAAIALGYSATAVKDAFAKVDITITAPQDTLVEIKSVSTGKKYALTEAKLGAKAYIDRTYTVNKIGAGLTGGTLVQTANDDKKVTTANHLVLKVLKAATVYVCYDKRVKTLPSWLKTGWTLTTESFGTTDSPAAPMKVYKKTVTAGTQLTLGGNLTGGASGAESNYLVVVK